MIVCAILRTSFAQHTEVHSRFLYMPYLNFGLQSSRLYSSVGALQHLRKTFQRKNRLQANVRKSFASDKRRETLEFVFRTGKNDTFCISKTLPLFCYVFLSLVQRLQYIYHIDRRNLQMHRLTHIRILAIWFL